MGCSQESRIKGKQKIWPVTVPDQDKAVWWPLCCAERGHAVKHHGVFIRTVLCSCPEAWVWHPDAFSSFPNSCLQTLLISMLTVEPMALHPMWWPMGILYQSFLMKSTLEQQWLTHFWPQWNDGEMIQELKLDREAGSRGCFFRCQ